MPFFILFLLTTFTPSHASRNHPSPPPSDLIRKTCSATTYADLCVSSLQHDPSVRTTAATPKDLSTILLSLAAANASDTSTYLSLLSDAATDEARKRVLVGCSGRYADARDSLRWSLDEVAAESYDYAYVHVSAATAYPGMCREMYRREGLAYAAEMTRREEALEKLCTVGMEVVASLG